MARTTGRSGDVTGLLHRLAGGDAAALDRLLPIVYEELRALARRRLRGERETHTLSTTALVHEAYLRLVGLEGTEIRDRAHFFAICARAMRQVLLDYADRVRARKRGGDAVTVSLNEQVTPGAELIDWDELRNLHEALEELEALDERQCRIVECRFFTGLTIRETALALDISDATVKREWGTARAWLNRRLSA